jgi:hypothetical protein
VNLRVNCIRVAKISRCENRAVFGFDTGSALTVVTKGVRI